MRNFAAEILAVLLVGGCSVDLAGRSDLSEASSQDVDAGEDTAEEVDSGREVMSDWPESDAAVEDDEDAADQDDSEPDALSDLTPDSDFADETEEVSLDLSDEEVASCAPVLEVECNHEDDDCDGMVDEVIVWEYEGEPRWYEPCPIDGLATETRVDLETGLEWIYGRSLWGFDSAPGFCASLAGGRWRVPTLIELGTLYLADESDSDCPDLYSDIWPSRSCEPHWSAEEADAGNGYAFDYRNGESTLTTKTKNLPVRCVREHEP